MMGACRRCGAFEGLTDDGRCPTCLVGSKHRRAVILAVLVGIIGVGVVWWAW